jgi:hypothetical protein
MDKEHYDTLATAVEQGLMAEFPQRQWKVAQYSELVEQGEIEDANDFPTWLVVEATTPNRPSRIRLRIPAQVIRAAPSVEALVQTIVKEFERAPRLALEMAMLLMQPYDAQAGALGQTLTRIVEPVVDSKTVTDIFEPVVESKLIWRAKTILMKRLRLSEAGALAIIRRRAHEKGVDPEVIAQMIVSAQEFLQGAAHRI